MEKFSLTLLRHGETTAKECLNGHHDVGLSSAGQEQMEQAIQSVPVIDRVVSSPLIRCADFAQSYATSNNLPYQELEQLKEMNFGKWDGKSFDYLYQHFPKQLDSFWHDPLHNPPPEGEATQHFYQRIEQAWQQLIEQKSNSLVVCHGGVIRFIIAKVLGIPLTSNQHIIALNIGYAAVVTIDIVIDDNGKLWQTLKWPKSHHAS